jgi:hypothetical protein
MPRRAIAVYQRRRAGNITKPIGLDVLAGRHEKNAGHVPAAAASMRLMCACAAGERSTNACVICGKLTSSV